jgi:hypothetical protein
MLPIIYETQGIVKSRNKYAFVDTRDDWTVLQEEPIPLGGRMAAKSGEPLDNLPGKCYNH